MKIPHKYDRIIQFLIIFILYIGILYITKPKSIMTETNGFLHIKMSLLLKESFIYTCISISIMYLYEIIRSSNGSIFSFNHHSSNMFY